MKTNRIVGQGTPLHLWQTPYVLDRLLQPFEVVFV